MEPNARFQLKDFPFTKIRVRPFLGLQQRWGQAKLRALRASIRACGFMPTIVACPLPGGRAGIGYGLHRLKAAVDVLGIDGAVPLLVKDMSIEEMFRFAMWDRRKEWGMSATAEEEMRRAVYGASQEGLVSMETVWEWLNPGCVPEPRSCPRVGNLRELF